MKLQDAKDGALGQSVKSSTIIVVVEEGPHADEFADRDEDGKSYGYCPEIAVHILYPEGVKTDFTFREGKEITLS